MKLELGEVQETLLIPLSNRAGEAKRKNPRVYDKKAADIINLLNIDIKKYDKLITHECVIARTIMFDNIIKNFVEKFPHSVFINIGCGLDDRFSRVDNGIIKWFDVDLPDTIFVRKKVFNNTDRRKMISGNILEDSYINKIKSHLEGNEESIVVIAEGLFMYFTREQHKKILGILADSFKTGYLIVELMKPCMMNEKRHQTVRKTKAKFGWGTNTGVELEELEHRFCFIEEHSLSEQLLKSTLISKIIGFIFKKVNNRVAIFKWI